MIIKCFVRPVYYFISYTQNLRLPVSLRTPRIRMNFFNNNLHAPVIRYQIINPLDHPNPILNGHEFYGCSD